MLGGETDRRRKTPPGRLSLIRAIRRCFSDIMEPQKPRDSGDGRNLYDLRRPLSHFMCLPLILPLGDLENLEGGGIRTVFRLYGLRDSDCFMPMRRIVQEGTQQICAIRHEFFRRCRNADPELFKPFCMVELVAHERNDQLRLSRSEGLSGRSDAAVMDDRSRVREQQRMWGVGGQS